MKKTVHIHIDYTNLPKNHFFIITTTHPTIFNTIINSIIPRITIFVNPTDKPLEIYKGIRLNTIYKFAETTYFLTNTSKVTTTLTVAITIFTEPLSQAQRDIILGFRYQHISLSSPAFSDRIATINTEFTFILEIEVELTYNPFSFIVSNRATPDLADTLSYISIRSDSPTPFTEMIYTIIEKANTI